MILKFFWMILIIVGLMGLIYGVVFSLPKCLINRRKKSSMEINEHKQKSIKWEFPNLGLLEATIWDGKLTDVRFCKSGSNLDYGLHATGGDEWYLRCVHTALGQLLQIMEKVKEDKSE